MINIMIYKNSLSGFACLLAFLFVFGNIFSMIYDFIGTQLHRYY